MSTTRRTRRRTLGAGELDAAGTAEAPATPADKPKKRRAATTARKKRAQETESEPADDVTDVTEPDRAEDEPLAHRSPTPTPPKHSGKPQLNGTANGVEHKDENPVAESEEAQVSRKKRKRQDKAANLANGHAKAPSKKAPRANAATSDVLTPAATFNVHRCRFVDWVPNPVTAMVSNHDGSCLAVARQGASIEIWRHQNGGWHQTLFVPGHEAGMDLNFAVLALSWLSNGEDEDRLFAGDVDGNLFEVDLLGEARVNETSSLGGAVWGMDTQQDTRLIALGCEDGRVRLFEAIGGAGATGVLDFKRTLRSNAEGRILSVKWHPGQGHNDILFTGGMDGLIRKWNASSGNVVQQIATESFGKSNAPCIWSLVVLRNSTVFSGDSEGHIHVWDTSDSGMGQLIASFQEHGADVTTLVASRDETAVFGSGIDSRVAMLRHVKGDEAEGRPDKWVYTYSHRPHSHDVRSLALADNGKLLVSGGNDTQLAYLPVEGFSRARPVKVSPFLHRPLVHVANSGAQVLVQHSFHLELWSPSTQELLLTMRFNERLAIRTSSLSPDGTLLACSDDNGLKVFQLRYRQERDDTAAGDDDASDDEAEPAVVPVRVRFDDESDALACGAVPVAMCFGPAKSKVLACATQTGSIAILRVSGGRIRRTATISHLAAARKSFLSQVSRKANRDAAAASDDEDDSEDEDVTMRGGESDEPVGRDGAMAVQHLQLSPDLQWLAVGDDSGTIKVFSVDTQQQHAELSQGALGGARFTSFAFQPVTSHTVLVVTTMANRFFRFDVDRNAMDDWTRLNGERLDPALLSQADRILGVSFDPARPDLALFWGRSFITKVDFSVSTHALEASEKGSLRFSTLQKYRPIIHLEVIASNEIMVMEAPWLKVMKTFKDPLFRRRFGGAN